MQLILKIGILSAIFILGELIVNLSIFKYLKRYFKITADEDNKPFLFFHISIFKGLLERLLLFIALAMNITQALIVFGAIKIGTRFDRNQKVLNDYFIIGNFMSIIISFGYLFCFQLTVTWLSEILNLHS